LREALSYKIKTFGCRLNFYESEVIRKFADKNKIENTTFINSCAVTNKTVRDLKGTIRKLKKEDPKNKIVLTGCAAQIHKEEFNEIEEISTLIGNREKLDNKIYKELSENLENKKIVAVSDILEDKKAQSPVIDSVKDKIRAFVQIQNGCDHRCTFCIIPFGRGNSRSVEYSIIIEQIRNLINKNYKEIVLTGVDLTSYGHDLDDKISLGQLIKKILNDAPELNRLRLSSLDVAEIDPDLFDVIENESRLLPHIHLSLQAGDNMILKRMKRRHSRDDSITETEEMFQNTINLIKECNITFLHVFPFSPRKGTPAARMPQVKGDIIKKRAEVLRQLAKKQITNYYKKVKDQKVSVIVESKNRGRTDNFAKISIPDNFKNGELLNMIVTGHNDYGLTGKVIV